VRNRRERLSDIQLQSLIGSSFNTQPHAGLWLEKYRADKDETENNSNLVREVASITTSDVYMPFFERWKEQLKACGAAMREAQVKGRMIVGLGSESVLETSIALHRTYGVPYISGSALKGLVASYVRQNLGDEWKKGTSAYKILFGDTDEVGYVTFFDSMYIPGTGKKGNPLYPDVITVHHPNYYGNAPEAPADWDSPNPVPFLSATGKYLIALAAPAFDARQGQEWIDVVFDVLKEAFDKMGIGAKTSSGYGRLELEAPAVDPELQKAKGYRNEIEGMPNASVASQINSYYQNWENLTSREAKKLLARAIVDKVRQAGREKNSAGKAWYQNLLAFLEDAGK
jgi:CRISPR-associated protein Cmr6